MRRGQRPGILLGLFEGVAHQHVPALADGAAEGGDNPYDHAGEFAAESGITEEAAQKHAVCDPEKCVLCGYCTGVCPVFALTVY